MIERIFFRQRSGTGWDFVRVYVGWDDQPRLLVTKGRGGTLGKTRMVTFAKHAQAHAAGVKRITDLHASGWHVLDQTAPAQVVLREDLTSMSVENAVNEAILGTYGLRDELALRGIWTRWGGRMRYGVTYTTCRAPVLGPAVDGVLQLLKEKKKTKYFVVGGRQKGERAWTFYSPRGYCGPFNFHQCL